MGVCHEQQAGLRSDNDKARPRILSNQGGQAVLEYILVLFVVVAILLGSLYQMNSAFKVWAENYFGSYLSCLLETGELPALGGSVGPAGGVCNELYEPFSIDKGRPLLASSQGGGGGSSGGSTSSSPPSSSSSSSSERGARDTGGGSSGSSQINSSARFTAGSRFRPNNEMASGRRADGSSYTGSTEGSVPTSLLGGDYGGRFKVSESGFSMDYGSSLDRERKKIESKEGVKKAEDSVQERGRKKANPVRAPASKAEVEEEEEMTFGSFLRFLIIAAIIIALILVVGGQLLQISKSSGSE